jgi:NADPH:quinone reductase
MQLMSDDSRGDTMKAVQISEFGGPEVMELADIPRPEPAEGQVLVEVRGAGINYADTHTRTDDYHVSAPLPYVPGGEIVGIRTDTGERVLALTGAGGYAEYALAPEGLTFPVPDSIPDGAALALLVQGVTAWHLLHRCARVQPGESVVVHAAAGGVGSLAVQLARIAGAGRVIATASTEEKRELALSLGAHVAVDPSPEGLAKRLREANGGAKVDVVLEMAGGQVFTESFRALGRFGRLVAYGNASREAAQLVSTDVQQHSRAVIGYWLVDCLSAPAELVAEPLAELFRLVDTGALEPIVGQIYPLADAARAHLDLEARRTTGKLVLDPVA